jgi:hypothetical protein
MDITEALKAYYARANMGQQFNVPTVVRISDSLGHVVHLSSSNRGSQGHAMMDYSNDPSVLLRCGETIALEADVDPTFDPKDYKIRWQVANISGGERMEGRKFVLVLTERHVSTRFCVVCTVTSHELWHKLGSSDDQIDIAYRVLPPA